VNDQPPPNPPNSNEPDAPWPPPGTGKWMLATLIVSVAIMLTKLYPFDFAAGAGPFFALRPVGYLVVLAEIALFIPLGFVETHLARRVLGHGGTTLVLMVAIDALLLSLVGETVQHWLPARTSSTLELAANTLGAVVGYKLAVYLTGR